MRFSEEYTKLQYPIFTTIRKSPSHYKVGKSVICRTPKHEFEAEIVSIRKLRISDVTETMALRDADRSLKDFRLLLGGWYDDFENEDYILLTLMRKDK